MNMFWRYNNVERTKTVKKNVANAKPQYIDIIQSYAPSQTVIEAFQEEFENTIKKSPRKDFLIVQGDWNA